MNSKQKNQGLIFSIVTSLMSASVISADSLTFKGNIETRLPEIQITSSGDPVADVKEFTLSVKPNAGVCAISPDVATAMNHGSTPICMIEWHDPQGLSTFLAGLKGVVSGEGEHTFGYTLKMFDLDSFENIHSSEYKVVFPSHLPPDAVTFNSSWKVKDPSTEISHDVYSRSESHLILEGAVTPRNYNQVIKFGNLECDIPEGSTECTIVVNETFYDKDAEGQKLIPFTVTDPYGFINDETNDFTYNFDFRPPKIIDVHVNANADMLPEVITDYGDAVVLYHNQAAVAVESPHDSSDPLFLPTDPTLKITKNKALHITNTVNYGGLNIKFNLGDIVGADDVMLEPINDPLIMGKNILYVYDFTEIKDGLYDFTFSTLDGNGNGEEKALTDIYVDRMPPDIQFVVNGRQHTSSSSALLYSISDLTILSWGGWVDGSRIESAKLNDEDISFSSGTDNVKRVEYLELPPNSINALEVTAVDAVGNKISKFLDFKFGSYLFKHKTQPVMAEVEPVNIDLSQSSGLYCVMFSDPDFAKMYSSEHAGQVTRGCTIEWLEIPVGLDVSMPKSLSRITSRIAEGKLQAGNHGYAFIVHSHDAFGNVMAVYEGQGEIEVLPLQAPILNVGKPHIYNNYPDDYKYTNAADYNLTFRSYVETAVDANLVVELYDVANQLIHQRNYPTARGKTNTLFTIEDTLPLLAVSQYKVKAYYAARPDIYSEKPYYVYTVPGLSVRLHLEHATTIKEGDTFAITARLGKRTAGEISYLPDMGIWNIGLYRFDQIAQKYLPLKAPVKTDAQGKANLLISADEMLLNENRVMAIATLDIPYPEVDVKRMANSLFSVPVLSASGISAQLISNVYTAPVPARFITRLEYETDIDQNTAGEVLWQKSEDDGATWIDLARKKGLNTFLFTLDEPGEILARAVIQNRLSEEVYYTNTVKYVGFEEALIELVGSQLVATGAIGKYGYVLNDFALGNLQGQVEWSVDNKLTWQAMSENESLDIDTAMDLHVRALIQDDGNPPFYIYDEMTVSIIPPRQLTGLLTATTNRAEIGDVIDVTGRIVSSRLYDEGEYRYEIVLPDGTTVSDLTVNHTFVESDFINEKATFSFRSWINDMKLETIATRSIYITQITYDDLPPTNVEITNPERVNFSYVYVRLKKPLAWKLPKSVEINQDIILPPDGELELDYVYGLGIRLVAKKEGLHPITVRFYDNRGNEREHTVFVKILAPPPMHLEITTRFYGEYFRPPMRLSNSLRFKFGSPNDRLDYVEWSINDELIETDSRTIKQQLFTEPGEYKISAKMFSKFGQEAETSEIFTLQPNQKPVCEPYWEFRPRVRTLFANCKDYDGKIMRVAFIYVDGDGNERTVYRYFNPSFSFIEGFYDDSVAIKLEAFDDSDAVTVLPVNWATGEAP
jgi:hypothetical protein